MSIVKKAIMISVGLIITVALCYLGIAMYKKATNTINIITENQDKTAQTMNEYAIMRYDGYEISGATAISYIKTVVAQYGIPVKVETSEGSSFTCTDSSVFKDFRDIGSSYYINPMKQYNVNVTRNQNDVITQVLIQYVP